MSWWQRRPRRALPADAERLFATYVCEWRHLTAAERDTLRESTARLLVDKTWEHAQGFNLTDEMCTVISAQASLLSLYLGLESFRRIRSIIVHPRTITVTGPRSSGVHGVVTDGPSHVLGQAHDLHGPLLLAWDTVHYEARHPYGGRNVAIHEFAHKIDMLDGVLDGTPPSLQGEQRERWVDVCKAEYRSVVSGRDEPFLDTYAATNAAEFFAVATESFFTRPDRFAVARPELYSVLLDFYGYDGAARRPAPAAMTGPVPTEVSDD
jgi:Mlc titration factor MtfA (ptsG expression regulator)